MTKTINGPSGYNIELDSTEIYPDDPGAGTPAMVNGPRGSSGTYWCVADTGEMLNGRGEETVDVPPRIIDWLDSKADEVDAFIDQHSK